MVVFAVQTEKGLCAPLIDESCRINANTPGTPGGIRLQKHRKYSSRKFVMDHWNPIQLRAFLKRPNYQQQRERVMSAVPRVTHEWSRKGLRVYSITPAAILAIYDIVESNRII